MVFCCDKTKPDRQEFIASTRLVFGRWVKVFKGAAKVPLRRGPMHGADPSMLVSDNKKVIASPARLKLKS